MNAVPDRHSEGLLPWRSPYFATAMIFVAAFIIIGALMDRSIGPYDESIILVGAQRMQAGELLHRDFYFLYGPASIWILSKLWLVGSAHLLIARLCGLITAAGIVALSFHLLAAQTRRAVALLFSAIVMTWLIALGNFLYPTFPCVLFMLLGSAMLIRRERVKLPEAAAKGFQPPSLVPLVAAGMCAGAASLFRYDAGVVIGLAQITWLALFPGEFSSADGTVKRLLAGAVSYGLGYIAIVAIPVAYYLSQAPLSAIWGDVIGSSTTYYITHRALPFPTIARILDHPRDGGVYIPFLAIATAAALAVSGARRRHEEGAPLEMPPAMRRFALLMAVSAVLLFYKGLVRSEALHFILSIIPATLLLAVCVDRLWTARGNARVAAIVVALITAAPSGRVTLGCASSLFQMPAMFMGGQVLHIARATDSAAEPIAACLPGASTYSGWTPLPGVQVSRFIRINSAPHERVFVAAGRTDQLFTNNVGLYFTMDRLPGTHWHAFDPGLQTRRDIQEQIVAELQRNDVRWIVRDPSSDDVREPNASSRSSGVFLLDRWIASHYRIIGRAPPMTVWLRNDLAAPRIDTGPPLCRLSAPEKIKATGA